jgi:hypothetical protein
MFGSKNKGEQRENAYDTAAQAATVKADTAIAAAGKPDELEQRRRDYVLNLDKWQNGENGPIDVRNMPGADVAMGLYNDSLKVHDANRIGRGYGTLAGNANPNFVAALDKENEMQRHQQAAGALEGYVGDTLAAKDQEMTGLYHTADARNAAVAGMQTNREGSAQDRYLRFLMRPKAPNFFRELALNASQGVGAGAAAAAIP